MANNCWNQITISGNTNTLKKIEEKFSQIDTGVLSYRNYSNLFDGDVTDVQGDEWGPKWFTPSIVTNDGKLVITGDSAWVPPVPLCELISDEWGVECELIYDEPGQDFAGSIIWNNGDVIDNKKYTSWEYKYVFDPYLFWEEAEYSMDGYETIEEWLEILNLDKWGEKPDLDMSKVKSIWSSIKYED